MIENRPSIDLNGDLGEAKDEAGLSLEARVMPFLTSVNIACGFHAGSPEIMRRTVNVARSLGLAIGAHPGFSDREGFGRRTLTLEPAQVEVLVAYQVGALVGIAALEGAVVTHVKPHGALYNLAAQDGSLSDAIARAVRSVDRRLVLVGLAGSHLIESGKALGLPVAEEVFADRAYSRNGALMPRDLPGAVIHKADEVLGRALQMIRDGLIPTFDGGTLPIHVDTICLHSDTPQADVVARTLREGLQQAGVQVAPLPHA